jgi:predicted nucleotidyltransferase
MEENLKKLLNETKKDKDILAVMIFGSFARGEEYRDIDVALILCEKKTKKEMSKIRLRYLSKFNSKLDIHIFHQLPLYIKIAILKEGKIILNKNEDLVYEIAFQTIKEFGFYKKIYDEYLQNVKIRQK